VCNFNTFLRSVTQPFVSAYDRATTAPGTGGVEAADASAAASQAAAQASLQSTAAALTASQQQASDAATAALRAQEAAAKRTEAAAVPQQDLESVRVARENRMRRLLAGGVKQGARFLGEAPLGFRMLTGQ
jgi:hypothetical protein